MPTVLIINGFRFFFYSHEGTEPKHIHIKKGNGIGKMWLMPAEWDYHYGFTVREINRINKIVADNRELLIKKWNAHFGK